MPHSWVCSRKLDVNELRAFQASETSLAGQRPGQSALTYRNACCTSEGLRTCGRGDTWMAASCPHWASISGSGHVALSVASLTLLPCPEGSACPQVEGHW